MASIAESFASSRVDLLALRHFHLKTHMRFAHVGFVYLAISTRVSVTNPVT